MTAKAAGMEVDHIFLDLEDAVAPAAKVPARAQIVQALNTLDFGTSVRCVRINEISIPIMPTRISSHRRGLRARTR